MDFILKTTILLAAILVTSCNELGEASCYDYDHLWDLENKVCSDDCVRKGGVFEVASKRCDMSSSLGKDVTDAQFFKSVQKTCADIQGLLKSEFNLSAEETLKHYSALDYNYPRLSPISYTSKYNFGQDGMCNFSESGLRIRVLIRKNANVASKYSANGFDVLKIEKEQSGAGIYDIIWGRD